MDAASIDPGSLGGEMRIVRSRSVVCKDSFESREAPASRAPQYNKAAIPDSKYHANATRTTTIANIAPIEIIVEVFDVV